MSNILDRNYKGFNVRPEEEDIVEDIKHRNNTFSKQCEISLFGTNERIKLTSKKVRKELRACAMYGSLKTSQAIVYNYVNGNYSSMEEMIGDLQNIIIDNRDGLKLSLNLKEPNYSLENLISDCEEKRIKNLQEKL